ncbi:hypothetical protein NC653_005229 [Populus alba x Populus x berolinensis]|nr:hypothetical protein NC653_005229 [Populus alba x Populus x berolinensis]
MTTKENLVKQHAKVAEEAVSGWEKAEAEALALKNHLETVTLSKLTAEDRASHLDGALKECMRQIRNLKEEHEQKVQEVVLNKKKQLDKIKMDFEAKIANLDQELLRSAAENAALSRSLQERSNMLIKISEERSQAEADIELLKSNIESCEREINSLKYELHVSSKELEIRNEEKNMIMRSAEAANKQHTEGVKKIAKLEAECQRLRGLVRKKLPGPAALAQMKLEVESLGRDYGDSRLRRSPVKPPSPHSSPVPEFSLDNVQKFNKENEFLTERLFAVEEETKMLKEALAKRNSELQASRNLCAKTASKLQSLEAQFQINNHQKSSPKSITQVPAEGYSSQNISNPPSLTSVSEDGNDDTQSCADSWATTSVSEVSHLKKDNHSEKSNKAENTKHLELMDDFLEMEKLACLNADSATTISSSPNNKASETANTGALAEVSLQKEDALSEEKRDLDPLVNHVSCNKDSSATNSGFDADLSSFGKLQSRISLLLESVSKEVDVDKILEEIKQVVHGAETAASGGSREAHHSDATCDRLTCPEDAVIMGEKEITLLQESKAATHTMHTISKILVNWTLVLNLVSPFKPFNQLLGVFPAAKFPCSPVHYRKLMTDPNSPIIDFYPTDFEVDMNGKQYAWQGIAKLPFIDESRLLAEVQKIEHTLTEEEARRNSMMFDMLFVSSSHSLSESMYLLDNHCKQLTDKERAEVKERINPELSDGMNGYLSPCAGDTHPPIVRSPVASMEDILANEVICVIYGLPDPHTHITCPPAGVIFPKKTVDQGDLKPEPILWHEDSGRRPWENDRRNPPGTISAHHLGEASHRLVSNSLQQKIDRNGYGNHMHTPPPPYFAAPCGPPHSFYSNGLHNHGHYGTLQPEIDYSHAGYPRSASPHMPTHYDHGFGSAGANPSYRRPRPQNERENQMSGPHPRQVYHPPEFHQNGRPRHPHGPVARASTGNSTFAYQGGFDASYQSYQSPGDGSHQQWGGRFPPPANHSNPSGNQFSALDHRGNKMPPQHGVANRRPQPPPGSANRRPHPPAGYGRQ